MILDWSSWLPEPVVRALHARRGNRGLWLVGGALRDRLLQRSLVDLDFAVERDARRLARQVADSLQAAYYDLDQARDAGRVLWVDPSKTRWTLDFARLRGPDIEADLRGRDFTINALALPLEPDARIIDPTGARQDLRDGVLRACSERSLFDDPVRALRAVRLAADLGFRIEPQTMHQARACASLLGKVSAERLRDELFRLLALPRPAAAIRVLNHLGLLQPLLPELGPLKGLEQPATHVHDVWNHTLAAVDALSNLLRVLGRRYDEEAASELALAQVVLRLGRFREPLSLHFERQADHRRSLRELLFLATLYHDVGKAHVSPANGKARFPAHEQEGAKIVRERGKALRLSGEEVDRLARIVRHHMRPAMMAREQTATPRAVYRFFRSTGDAGVDVVLLSLADFLAKHTPPVPQEAWARHVDVARLLLEAFFEEREERINPPPFIDGDMLMRSLGIEPGPEVGRLLDALREAQAVGEVGSAEEALALARRLQAQGGAGEAGDGG